MGVDPYTSLVWADQSRNISRLADQERRREMRVFAIILIITFLSSCERQQELCFNHEQHDRVPVDVVFDWSIAPDADPISMSLYLFPDDGLPPSVYQFSGRDGGRIMALPGKYTALAINTDTENSKVHNADLLETFEIRLVETNDLQGLNVRSKVIPRAPGTETESMACSSDMIWRARTDDVEFKQSDDSPTTLIMHPSEAVFRYSVEINNVENLSCILSMSASVTGMSGSMFVADGLVSDEAVTIPFDLSQSDKTSVRGEWITFGHCGHSRSRTEYEEYSDKHFITVYAVLIDGSQWYHSFDITSLLHNLSDDQTLIRIDEGLHIPQVSQSDEGAGFNISIDDWQTLPVDIPM